MSNSNRIKIFSDLVSLDAWHETLAGKNTTVKLFADVTFDTARLGAEAECIVRFQLSVKRVELTVIVPETEPMRIDKSSVHRTSSSAASTKRTKTKLKTSGHVSGGFGAQVSERSAKLSLAAKADASKSFERTEEWASTESVSSMATSHSLDGEGNNRWRIVSLEDRLKDRPWIAKETPLLKLVLRHAKDLGVLEPCTRLELSCKREDLIIEGIELKDAGLWDKVTGKRGHNNRLLAVEALIRTKLAEFGLTAGDLAEPYSNITLAEIVAT